MQFYFRKIWLYPTGKNLISQILRVPTCQKKKKISQILTIPGNWEFKNKNRIFLRYWSCQNKKKKISKILKTCQNKKKIQFWRITCKKEVQLRIMLNGFQTNVKKHEMQLNQGYQKWNEILAFRNGVDYWDTV